MKITVAFFFVEGDSTENAGPAEYSLPEGRNCKYNYRKNLHVPVIRVRKNWRRDLAVLFFFSSFGFWL